MAKHEGKYDKFYIATDDQQVLNTFIETWGDRVIYQQATRAHDQQAVHTDFRNQDRHKLGLEALTDAYMLASCQRCILVHSNLSYAPLLINPDLPYKLLETAESRRYRWRTSLLYWLDRWGIRKM